MRAVGIAADAHRDTRAFGRAGRTVGVKVTAIVQVEFADALPVHVPPVTAKSPAFAPVMLSFTDSAKPDRFVTVTSLVFVGALAVSVPNASVAAGVTVAGIVAAVVNETV